MRQRITILSKEGYGITEFFHKLIYKSDTYEARIATTVENLSLLESLPEDIKNRVINKFSDIRTQGLISVYSTKFDLADLLIQKIKKYRLHKIQPRRPVIMNLCEGLPEASLSGLAVASPSDQSGKFYLTVNLSKAEISSVPVRIFLNTVRYLAESHIFRVNEAQLRGLYAKACEGSVNDVLLIPGKLSQKLKDIAQDASFLHIYEKSLDEYILCLLNLRSFKDKESKIKLIQYLKDNLPQDECRILQEEEILDRIETALCGPEYFGFQLPVTILSTKGRSKNTSVSSKTDALSDNTVSNHVPESSEPSGAKASVSESGHSYPGKGLLSLKVSADRCSGVISGFKLNFYRDPDLSLDESWFKNETLRLKIHKIPPEQYKRVIENLRRQKDLSGIQIASGDLPEKAANPVIVPVEATESSEKTGVVALSKLPLLVKAGDKIASLMYQKEAKAGLDIFGQTIEPPPPEPGGYTLGPGAEFREDGFFYATVDGRAILEKSSIEVCKSLEIAGDVNASFGFIEFDGPVFIEGNVESGSRIRTTGSLSVGGNLEHSHIYVKGDTHVQGGVITGPKGYLRVGGNLHAEYLENSVVICRGDLTIRKSVMMSTVYVEGKMTLTESGARLNSSKIFVYHGLDTPNLGSPHGMETLIWPGSYWRQIRILENNRYRYQNLNKKLEETKILLHDFKKQNKPPYTQKKESLRESLIEKIKRLNHILEKLSAFNSSVEKIRCPNLKSYVLVRETLSPNCQIILSDGRKVRSPAELMGIAIDSGAEEGKEIVDIKGFKVPDCILKPVRMVS